MFCLNIWLGKSFPNTYSQSYLYDAFGNAEEKWPFLKQKPRPPKSSKLGLAKIY